ncbi:MAG TPA: hypothetical protein VIY29_11975 [Ktedonobacteraceae bacterium]
MVGATLVVALAHRSVALAPSWSAGSGVHPGGSWLVFALVPLAVCWLGWFHPCGRPAGVRPYLANPLTLVALAQLGRLLQPLYVSTHETIRPWTGRPL